MWTKANKQNKNINLFFQMLKSVIQQRKHKIVDIYGGIYRYRMNEL